MKINILTLAAASLLMVNAAAAKEYYVSPNGNDTNSGEVTQPFKTIAQASSIMEAGDKCIIMEGTYHEVIKPSKSGANKKTITYANYKNDRVVIDAAEPIEGWTKYKNNIYKVKHKLPASCAIYNTLFFEGELMDIARYPNNGDGDRFTFDGAMVDGGSDSHFDISNLPEGDLTGGYFCYLGAHSGTSWSRKITGSEEDKIHFEGVDIHKWPYTPHNPTIFRNNNYGQLYVYGKLELLDQAGEWHYDADNETIYAIFPDNCAPKDGVVKAGVRKTTMEIDQDYIDVDGLVFFGGETRISGNNCNITNSEFMNCSQTLDGLIGIDAQSETASILINGGSDIKIANNLIEGGLASGIVIFAEDEEGGGDECKNHTIHNNVIRYFNSIGIHANAIRSRGGLNTVITNNTIYTCGRDGITTFGKRAEIAYNDVYDCMRINNDGGVFYTVGNDELKHSEIHHNYFHDSYGPAYADGRAAGIYLDNNSKGYDVHNNIVANVTWSGLMFNWYNTDFNFYNNTMWNCGYNMGRWANGYTIDRIRVVNNYANTTSRDKIEKTGDQAEWIGTEFATNILVMDESPFIDPENGNFIPKKGSYLIDKGTKIKGFSKGYRGKRPDVGAYEYGEKPWNIGASWADDVAKNIDYDSQNRSHGVTSIRESEDDFEKKRLKAK